jgi:catechol 2,3-dioxygenase-like lactoylglutathione lyase family enzyme
MNDTPFTATSLGASLTASDLAASVAWYRDVLGFTVEREFERDGVRFAVRMGAGSVALLLTRDDGAKGLDRVKGQGISLQFTTTQNVDDLAARVKAHGVTLDTEPADVWGARVFRVRDPDGFRLVISSEREAPQR